MTDARRLSVLDLGSNSFHILVADVGPNGAITPVSRHREMLHLGEAVGRHGSIPEDKRAEAVDVVAQLTELAGRLGATERLAVATSALREADNGAVVVSHMEAAADTTIEVIDGIEEARLGFKGLAAAVGAANGTRLVLDLGGGSLEFALGTGDTMERAVSLPIGVSRMSTLLDDDPPSKQQVKHLRDLVRKQVRAHRDDIPLDDVVDVVAIGGTVRALTRVVAKKQKRWWPATVNLLPMDRPTVKKLRKKLTRMDHEQRLDVKGMKTKRADKLHVAAVIVDTVLKELGIDQLRVSDWGLREGVLLDRCGITETPLDELRAREVARMQHELLADEDIAHLDHVADLAAQLFDALGDLHGLVPADRELLVHGARLHGVGRTLALRKQHHHGAYLIEHFELRGFTPLEVATLCSMARFHKTRGTTTSYKPYRKMGKLDRADRRRADQLIALLQVADALDRARDQAVTHLDAAVLPDRVVLKLDGTRLGGAVENLQRRTNFFEEVFDTTIDVRTARLADR